MASDADLVLAFDGRMEGLSPRDVIETIVAADAKRYWRLLALTLPAADYLELWQREGSASEPWEWRCSLVMDLLRDCFRGDIEPSVELFENLRWFFGVIARELAA